MTTHNEMTDLLATIYASFGSGDVSSLGDLLADDALCIGTDEAEWFRGKDEMMPKLSAQFAELSALGVKMTPGDAVVGGQGDVMWAADRPTLNLPDGTAMPLRATVLASRANGALVLEQMHLSVGAPNEDVVQQTLTV